MLHVCAPVKSNNQHWPLPRNPPCAPASSSSSLLSPGPLFSLSISLCQMDQKHAVEDVLLDAGLPGLMLEATMFMEEFWKRYTRPGLLKGTFTFSLPGDKPLQLVAARDVGLAAANALSSSDPHGWAGQRLPLAGDELTPLQMCAAFSKAQGGMPVKHSSPPAWIFWFLSR